MSRKKTGKKAKCWLCGSWQDETYTDFVPFHDVEERVCLSCITRMEMREDQLEQKLLELEDTRRFANGNAPAEEDYLP